MSPPEKDASLDPVAIGAEIGAALWRDRSFDADRGPGARLDALAWVRASRASRCAVATDEQRGEPAALLSAVVPSDGSGTPIAGVLEATARDLRLALSWLSGAKITKRGVHGYEPKDDDVFAMLLDAERRVSVAVRAVRLEHDAALLAIHSAACGAFPEALRAPGDCREDACESAIERAARARGADSADVTAATAVARAWGLGDLGEGAERLLAGLGRLRADLAAPTAPRTGHGSTGES